MSRRLVNALLLASIAALVLTGALGWLVHDAWVAPAVASHRIVGIAVVLALLWKGRIVFASLRRRVRTGDRSVALGRIAAASLLASLGLGVAWSAGLLSFDRPWEYSALNLHVFAGAGLVPFAVWHALRRRDAPPRGLPLFTRRGALRLLGLGTAAIALTALIDAIAPARRATGSKHAGSFSGNDFPLTIWAFDEVPRLDVREWTLGIGGAVERPGRLRYDELVALGEAEHDAVLDCTGGWWSEQRWRGVPVSAVLAGSGVRASARRVEVLSVTGHRWSFSRAELDGALLATHVGGERLTPGHGYPVRLIVPGYRGYQWVKWVDRLDVS